MLLLFSQYCSWECVLHLPTLCCASLSFKKERYIADRKALRKIRIFILEFQCILSNYFLKRVPVIQGNCSQNTPPSTLLKNSLYFCYSVSYVEKIIARTFSVELLIQNFTPIEQILHLTAGNGAVSSLLPQNIYYSTGRILNSIQPNPLRHHITQ